MITNPLASLRASLILALFLLSVVPALVVSFYLVGEFSEIQGKERLAKLNVETTNVTQLINFKLSSFHTKFQQAAKDNLISLAAMTGTFSNKAREKLSVILDEQDMISAMVLVDQDNWTVTATPLYAELLEIESLFPYFSALYQQGYQARTQTHILESPSLVKDLGEKNLAPKQYQSDHLIVFVAPLFLSDLAKADEFAEFTGLLIALLPMENLLSEIKFSQNEAYLANASINNQAILTNQQVITDDALTLIGQLEIPEYPSELVLAFDFKRELVFQPVTELTQGFLSLTGIFLAVFMVIAWGIALIFLKPLKQLQDLVQAYFSGEDKPKSPKAYFSEIEQIITLLATMAGKIELEHENLERRVHERTQELITANNELSEAMEQLTLAQQHIIETEKMSLLGQLVAGVAHEINTPLGICLTAGTCLQSDLVVMEKAYKDNKMTRKSLEAYFSKVDEGFSIILNNIQRASSLIQHFKEIAVDSTSEQLRRFKLKEYIEEILHSLQPETKKYNLLIEINGDDSLQLDSYPGAYAQIISNMVINSLRHGFSQNDSGSITIDFTVEGEKLIFTYKDSGKGVNEEDLDKIFAPFYTTLRNKGGSGLGLNIIFNLVTQTLQGKVKTNSKLGHGLTFIFTLPLKLKPLPTE
ncbi:sensor histidine kinase [Catenovulum maritimum]|uniref:sensor histidine kinase n=1 Tax=Catenovulum maritimum TaxID=1513271 RepID=UPI00065FEF4A|nr:HAMP domain-containing sensor histidine kinase [Catenovulum maritimum]